MTSSSNSISRSEGGAGWLARLDLAIGLGNGKSTIVERRHEGPLVVQRPFHPERDGTCHVLLLHPPGGLVSSDRLRLSCEVREGALALLTTPAATKLYRARLDGPPAEQHTTLRVGARACLEYLPQETIVFDGARAELTNEVHLHAQASFMGWEIACLGRPAAQERFQHGSLVQRWLIQRGERPLFIERLRLAPHPTSRAEAGGSSVLDAPFGLRSQPVTGTFVAVPREDAFASDAPREARLEHAAEAVRSALERPGLRGLVSVSARAELVVTRYLGPSTEEARAVFEQAWSVLRGLLFDKRESAPRIWKT